MTAVVSCKKSEITLLAESLNGNWELQRSSGGIAGTITNYPIGNGNIITFRKDKQYTWVHVSSGGTVTESGTFWLSTTTYSRGEKVNKLNLKRSNASQISLNVSIENELLYLSDGFDDGYTSAYIRR